MSGDKVPRFTRNFQKDGRCSFDGEHYKLGPNSYINQDKCHDLVIIRVNRIIGLSHVRSTDEGIVLLRNSVGTDGTYKLTVIY